MKKKYLAAMVFAAALPTFASADALDSINNLNSSLQKIKNLGGNSDGPLGELTLTQEQRQKIDQLQLSASKDQNAIYQKYMAKLPEDDQKALKAELAESADKSKTQLKDVLNADQQKKLQLMKSDLDLLNFK